MEWKFEKLYPGIFHLQFANHYDACMHFLRYQENYESPEWRGKQFTLLDYMEWYAKTQCEWKKERGKKKVPVQMFSYPGDWGGFNIPSYVFDRTTPDVIPDFNRYDKFMQAIVDSIREMGVDKFYLIGTVAGPNAEKYLDHEVAHGFYYTCDEYHEAVNAVYYDKTPLEVCHKLKDWLEDAGYCDAVLVDESHAYLATGLPDKLKDDVDCKKARAPFQRLFRKQKKAMEQEGFCHYV